MLARIIVPKSILMLFGDLSLNIASECINDFVSFMLPHGVAHRFEAKHIRLIPYHKINLVKFLHCEGLC